MPMETRTVESSKGRREVYVPRLIAFGKHAEGMFVAPAQVWHTEKATQQHSGVIKIAGRVPIYLIAKLITPNGFQNCQRERGDDVCKQNRTALETHTVFSRSDG